jgi:hypothetical protein
MQTCALTDSQGPAAPHVPKTTSQPTRKAVASDRLQQAVALSRTEAALEGAGRLDANCREGPLVQRGDLALHPWQELRAAAKRPAQEVPAVLLSSGSSRGRSSSHLTSIPEDSISPVRYAGIITVAAEENRAFEATRTPAITPPSAAAVASAAASAATPAAAAAASAPPEASTAASAAAQPAAVRGPGAGPSRKTETRPARGAMTWTTRNRSASRAGRGERDDSSFIEVLNRGRHHALWKWSPPRHAGCTHACSLARSLARSHSNHVSLFLGLLSSFYSSYPLLKLLLLYVLRLLSFAYSSMLLLCEDYCLAMRSTMSRLLAA